MDVLRGFAILGILLANIPAFAGPTIQELIHGSKALLSPIDQWVEALTHAFVTGKARSTLAILFGVGLALQFARRDAEGSWPGGYLKRNLFLGLIGIAHGLLIWAWDILFVYSLVAFACVWLVGLPAKWLKAIIWVIAAGAFLIAAGLAAVTLTTPESSTTGMEGLAGVWPLGPSDEMRTFAHEGYLKQVQARFFFFPIGAIAGAAISPGLLALFLVGVLFARSGVLSAPSQHPKTRNAALGLGLGVGLPLNLLALTQIGNPNPADFTPVWELFIGPLMAPAYVMLIAMAVERGRMGGVGRALEAVGRMSLTAYLSQSVLCTAIFYSWGGGLFGKLAPGQYVLVVPCVWAVNILFARWWLGRYSIGPMEWVLRSLTEGRRLPWRNEAGPPGDGPAPTPA